MHGTLLKFRLQLNCIRFRPIPIQPSASCAILTIGVDTCLTPPRSTSMKKLILGIVAVVCAQIMFQVLMAVDRWDTVYRAKIAAGMLVRPLTVPGGTDPAVTPENVDLARTDEHAVIVRKRPQRARIEPQTLIARRSVERRFDRSSMLAMTEAPSRPAILPLQPDDEYTVRSAASESARSGNKSFFAKALPIVKKPYGWLKAVGSKLK